MIEIDTYRAEKKDEKIIIMDGNWNVKWQEKVKPARLNSKLS